MTSWDDPNSDPLGDVIDAIEKARASWLEYPRMEHEIEILRVPKVKFDRVTWDEYIPMCSCGWVGRPPKGYFYTQTGATNTGERHVNPEIGLPFLRDNPDDPETQRNESGGGESEAGSPFRNVAQRAGLLDE
jgi:hypothetical protein